jgi:hypothetical protein
MCHRRWQVERLVNQGAQASLNLFLLLGRLNQIVRGCRAWRQKLKKAGRWLRVVPQVMLVANLLLGHEFEQL